MKPSTVAAFFLGLAPLVSLAQASDAPAAAQAAVPAQATAPIGEPVRPWSLGAGLGWSVYRMPYLYLGSLLDPPSAPTVHASLERAVAPGSWLEFGFAGFVDRQRGDAPDASSAVTRNDQSSAALNLGVRRALTRPGAPVCVSVDLALVAGYAASRVEWAAFPPQTLRGKAWQLGLATGLAVERELTSGLSLRVGTSLLGASWTQSSAESPTRGKATQRGGSAYLELSPWLELRQAF